MFKFIGKALAGLVLTKEAQTAIGSPAKGKRTSKGRAGKATTTKVSVKDAAIAQVQAQAKDLMTADRAELIRNAMKVRAAKQTILADLSDESRARLVALAMKALLNEGKDKKG